MLRLIERQHGATVAELARIYGVATVTVHRDLEALAREGAIERVRGGARAIATAPSTHSDFDRRYRASRVAKEQIARRAAALVSEGMTVFMDSSTSCLALAVELASGEPPGITVVTNSPAIAYVLKAPTIHIIVTPGEVDQDLMLIGGRWTVEFIRRIQLEVAFISGAGLTLDHGLATRQRDIADVLHAVRAVARRTVALVDSSKFGVSSLLSISPAREIDEIIVDGGERVAEEYRLAGVPLTIADGPDLRGADGDHQAAAGIELVEEPSVGTPDLPDPPSAR
jgi:DeoR/GlpR family transcriptional regulator of sugar metabolism